MITRAWWDKKPLRFECQSGCTDCCKKPGVVVMDAEDVLRASHHLKISPEQFKSQYLKRDGYLWLVDVTEKNPCPFLLPAGCQIHHAKPKQCQDYPFWPENVASERAWQAAAVDCPGINAGPPLTPATWRGGR